MPNESQPTPRKWRYKETRGFPHDFGRPHSVMGEKHADGGDYAPLASFRDKGDAILAAAAPNLLSLLEQLLEQRFERPTESQRRNDLAALFDECRAAIQSTKQP